jgi:16S rRNA C967 or C1407 C5-methylase (RsmB/RsmF family)
VNCVLGDFLKTDPNDEKYKNVRYIMLDPSCSGSGMLNNLFFSENNLENLEYEEKCVNLYKNLNQDDKLRAI